MKLTVQHSDAAMLAELGRRLMQTRLGRNLTQERLAVEAGVSKRTIERLETGHSTQLASLIRVLRALDLIDGLDRLVPEPLASPLAQLELEGRKRERASRRSRGRAQRETDWSWDDGQ